MKKLILGAASLAAFATLTIGAATLPSAHGQSMACCTHGQAMACCTHGQAMACCVIHHNK